jgi:hypothetical protein
LPLALAAPTTNVKNELGDRVETEKIFVGSYVLTLRKYQTASKNKDSRGVYPLFQSYWPENSGAIL